MWERNKRRPVLERGRRKEIQNLPCCRRKYEPYRLKECEETKSEIQMEEFIEVEGKGLKKMKKE